MCDTHIVTETATKSDKVESFRKAALKEYDQLYAEMEFFCKRAAMMHQYEASRYDRLSSNAKTAAEVVGTSSVTSVLVATLTKQFHSLASRARLVALIGLPLAVGLEFLSEGTGKILPSLHDKVEKHNKSMTGWQRLARVTESYRILMDDPRHDVSQFVVWYKEMLDTQQDIANIIVVPDSTVELFDDPAEVIKPLRKYKLLFQKYVELQKQSLDEPEETRDVPEETPDV